jgi:hypothetical protein
MGPRILLCLQEWMVNALDTRATLSLFTLSLCNNAVSSCGRKLSWPNLRQYFDTGLEGLRKSTDNLSWYPISGPRFETDISWIRNKNASHSIAHLVSCFLNIHINIMFLSTLRSPRSSLPFRFPVQFYMHILPLPWVLFAVPFWYPSACHSNIICSRMQIPIYDTGVNKTVYDDMNVLKLIALFSAFCRWVFVIASAHCFS